ncbi:oxygenase MpaB family protein [Larkinella soli]|uniref:oxygenase MpaB family protein n=1 Tax=Larkinella soli TaxID=1770527 RepID=UPI000FFB301E|nr:oxygenase MpaB family protein [Larkinella soli]
MLKTVKPSRTFPDHLLQQYRGQGDPAADAVIEAVAGRGGRSSVGTLMRWLVDTRNLDPSDQPPAVQQFIATHKHLPDWADRRRMERAMRFFREHAGAVALALGCYALPYCYAGADGAQVLWLSQRIHNDTRKRLEETGEWIFGVMKKSDWENGRAVHRTLKVRLMHAAIRWFTLNDARWNTAWGHPVNQEDMAGTNLAFSYIVIRGLRKAGITASEEDEEAFLHHINVTAYLLGVREELLPGNLREAYQLDRAIARRQFRASEQGKVLTRSLLAAIESLSPPALRNLPAAQMRFFLGDEMADLLSVPKVPLETRLVGMTRSLPIFPKLLNSLPY